MRTESGILIVGRVKLELFDADGNLKTLREGENIITTVGRAAICELMLAAPAANQKPTHMGVGTSGTPAALGDTTITGETRVALTSKTRGTNVLTMVANFGAGVATGSLQEAGMWDLNAAGQLLSRFVYTTIPKGASDTLAATYTWTFA